MNIVNLVGRLTKDPEIGFYGKDKEKCYAHFTVAVSRNKDEADFIQCTAFDKTAEFLGDYFRKGHRIGVIGRIKTDKYEDEDGNTVWTTEVIAISIDMIETKDEAEAINERNEEKDKKPAASKGKSRR